MLKNTLKVTFMDNEFKNFHNIEKIDLNFNSDVYRLIRRDNRKIYLSKNEIYSFVAGVNVEVDTFNYERGVKKLKNFEQPTIKILKRLFDGKDETNIHISHLNLVDYEVIEMITNYKLSETHTRNQHFRDVVTLKFKKKE